MEKIYNIFKNLEKYFGTNITRTYLILANIILVVFAIWFSNVGILPLKNLGDFSFFLFLAMILALYRPGWTFVFFVGSLALENINLAPESFGLTLRPYQFLGAITIMALLFQIFTKRLPFSLPKFKWFDALLLIFSASGFLSAIFSENFALSFKQSIIAFSFVALYFLVRVYVQSLDDLKKIMPFFLSSAVVVMIYGIWQNVRFNLGANSFEVMPGRPNATFTEPDWLGIFLVFLLSVLVAIIYSESKKTVILNSQFSILKQITNHKLRIAKNISLVILTLIVLMLTVSRSAWLGAIFVMVVFLKIMLTNGEWKLSKWNFPKFFHILQFLAVAIICSVAVVYILGLTRFQLLNRAASTGGMQKITIACNQNSTLPILPKEIGNTKELEKYGCKHINLEDVEKEKLAGNFIAEIFRPDPNISIRSDIYEKSLKQIKNNPIFGIGWGNIGKILGIDERGASLNASNIFLEVWLGAGALGFFSFVILLIYIFIRGVLEFWDKRNKDKTENVFVMLGWIAIVIPNLFNSGIFLGFIWVYLAIAVNLLVKNKKS